MNKKMIVLLAAIAFVALVSVLVVLNEPISIRSGGKPLESCKLPSDGWAACSDFTSKGISLDWGAEQADNFIEVVRMEDWQMMWNGTAFDRDVQKRIIISSSLLPDRGYGDCSGWWGICYKYAEYSDTVKQ